MLKFSTEVEREIGTNKYYPYFKSEDIDNVNQMWYIAGLFDTDEIMVILTEDGNILGSKKARSKIKYPIMAERLFGIAASDLDLAKKLSDDLYEELAES